MEIISGIIGLVGAIIGAFIAGYYSRQATQDLLNEERAKREIEKREKVKALLCVLFAEIKSVWLIYMNDAGKHVEALPPNNPFNYYFPIIGDYFSIYQGNVGSLGLIEDENLRNKIILTYSLAKSLVDSFRLNNEFYKERQHASDQVFYNNTSQAQIVLKVKNQNLNAYGPMIKTSHQNTKNAVEELLKLMEPLVR